MTPAEQKAYYAKNKAAGDAAGKAYEQRLVNKYKKENADAGESAIKGMEEGRMDQMGNAYKAGGHVEHKEMVKKHASGFKHHSDHVVAMCGGGYMKGKK
jgi:hypothetical protein